MVCFFPPDSNLCSYCVAKITILTLCLDRRPTGVQCFIYATSRCLTWSLPCDGWLLDGGDPLPFSHDPTSVSCLRPLKAGREFKCFPGSPRCVSGARTRGAACARSTSTSGGTSTGSGSMSPKVTKPTSVPATVLTSGVPTTTITWWVGMFSFRCDEIRPGWGVEDVLGSKMSLKHKKLALNVLSDLILLWSVPGVNQHFIDANVKMAATWLCC